MTSSITPHSPSALVEPHVENNSTTSKMDSIRSALEVITQKSFYAATSCLNHSYQFLRDTLSHWHTYIKEHYPSEEQPENVSNLIDIPNSQALHSTEEFVHSPSTTTTVSSSEESSPKIVVDDFVASSSDTSVKTSPITNGVDNISSSSSSISLENRISVDDDNNIAVRTINSESDVSESHSSDYISSNSATTITEEGSTVFDEEALAASPTPAGSQISDSEL